MTLLSTNMGLRNYANSRTIFIRIYAKYLRINAFSLLTTDIKESEGGQKNHQHDPNFVKNTFLFCPQGLGNFLCLD